MPNRAIGTDRLTARSQPWQGGTPATPHLGLPVGWAICPDCPTWHSNLYYWRRPSDLLESVGKLLVYQNLHRDTWIKPKMISNICRWISTIKIWYYCAWMAIHASCIQAHCIHVSGWEKKLLFVRECDVYAATDCTATLTGACRWWDKWMLAASHDADFIG